METIRATSLWKRTLGGSAGDGATRQFRSRLRNAFEAFRSRAEELAKTIPDALGQLTVHDMKHIDALWEVADILIADTYPINPTEAFILGGGFPGT